MSKKKLYSYSIDFAMVKEKEARGKGQIHAIAGYKPEIENV